LLLILTDGLHEDKYRGVALGLHGDGEADQDGRQQAQDLPKITKLLLSWLKSLLILQEIVLRLVLRISHLQDNTEIFNVQSYFFKLCTEKKFRVKHCKNEITSLLSTGYYLLSIYM